MALGRMPSAIRRLMSGILALAVAFRPLYLPAAFALAMPSRWRSNALRMSRHVPWRLYRSLLSGVTPVSDAATSGRRRETRQIGRPFHVTTDLPLLAFSNFELTSRTLMLLLFEFVRARIAFQCAVLFSVNRARDIALVS